MIHRFRLLGCVLGATFVLSLAVRSQEPAQQAKLKGSAKPKNSRGIGFSLLDGGENPAETLGNPGVRKELKLTDEQAKSAERLSLELRRRLSTLYQAQSLPNYGKNREDVAAPKDADEAALPLNSSELRLMIFEAKKENADRVGNLLDAGQKRRLREITYQMNGSLVFARPEVLERLNLSFSQRETVRQILVSDKAQFDRHMMSQRQELLKQIKSAGERPTPAEVQAFFRSEAGTKFRQQSGGNIGKDREKSKLAIAKALTRSQRRTLNELLGDPFDRNAFRLPEDPPKEKKEEDEKSTS